ncbi:MAG: GNAT family N-acetyltransferase [Sulfurimonas sp.]|uniref:GNAT family N-acetyltransferase n=1 Tax=Sulfurimonas sp. TaxID=2022749 RepID=UPI00260FC7C4|nr:GNAT family N-acetyltransferase [Sulfurimonas sp.]MDD5373361.1 GNAT family N-acetyltransferase [Sulfurimonas sp.]
MEEIQQLINISRDNYKLIRQIGLDFEAVEAAELDYFRALLLGNGSYNAKKFEIWCENNNLSDFFDSVQKDVAYLKKINVLTSSNGVDFQFRSARVKNTLLSYQKKSIEKNTQLIALLDSVKDDKIYRSLTRDQVSRFEKEILSSKERVEKFLSYSSMLGVNDFNNSVVSYLACVDNKIEPSLVKSREEWLNLDIRGRGVEISPKAAAIRVLEPLVLGGKLVGYKPVDLFDISQTNLSKEDISFFSGFSDEEILKRVRDSVASSRVISEIVDANKVELDGSLQNVIAKLGGSLADHYLLSEDERSIFVYTFTKSLGVESSLSVSDLDGIKNRIKSALSTLNLVNNELLLGDVRSKHILKDNLYFNLGKKDSENLSSGEIEKRVEMRDETEYRLGLDFPKINLRGSYQIAKEILDNEDISFETNFESLFAVTKKLNIKSGDFKGKSFVVEDSLNDDELKEFVAREFLQKLVEERLSKQTIKRINNEFTRDSELFSRKYSDDTRRLYDERRFEKSSQNGERGDSSSVSVPQSGSGDGYAEQPDRAGVQGERGVGDSILRDDLHEVAELSDSEANKIHNKFKKFIKELGEDIPVLNSTGLHNILHGEHEFIKIYATKSVDDHIKVVDFDMFGVRYSGQTLAEFSQAILSSDAFEIYKKEWLISDNDKEAIIKATGELGLTPEFSDETYKKMFSVSRKEAIGDTNSVLTLKLSDESGVMGVIEQMKSFRNRYPLLKSAKDVGVVSDKYRYLFENAVFGEFKHTQTREILNTMTLGIKLSKDEFKEFNKYLSQNKMGYYSRIAKSFIMTDGKILDAYKKEQRAGGLEATSLDGADESVASIAVDSNNKKESKREPSADLIRNAEFIKSKTGLDYAIRHHQNATFLTDRVEFEFSDGGRGYSLLLPINDKAAWSVKERWLRSDMNRKRFIESINETLEKERGVSERTTAVSAVGDKGLQPELKLTLQVDIPELGVKKGDVITHNGETANTFKFITPSGKAAYVSVGLGKTHDEVAQKYFAIDAKDYSKYKRGGLAKDVETSKNEELVSLSNESGQLYGSINLKDKVAKISSLEIKPSLQKSGFGSALVKEFEERCLAAKITDVRIDAYKKSLEFWKKIGFSVSSNPQIIDGHIQDYYDGSKVLFSNIYLGFANRLEAAQSKKAVTDLYYELKENYVSNSEFNEAEYEDIKKKVDEKLEQLDEKMKNSHLESIASLKSQGNRDYLNLLSDYNLKYEENILDSDIVMERKEGEKESLFQESHFKYEISADRNLVTVSNLKDFYLSKEIESKFINRQVQWEIFSNKYIFNLNDEAHVALLRDELGILADAKEEVFQEANQSESTLLINSLIEFAKANSITVRKSKNGTFFYYGEKVEKNKFNIDDAGKIKKSNGTEFDYRYRSYFSNEEKNPFAVQDVLDEFELWIKESKKEVNKTDNLQKNIAVSEVDNFTIESDISLGGAKTKFKNYLAGVEVLRKVEAGEEISKEDRIALSKMPGVGTIAQAFPRSDGSVAQGWESAAIELKEALSDAEYKQAQRATLDAYYTDENIIKAMWSGIERFGFKGGSVLEPSVGVGNFFGYMPKSLKPNTQLLGIELDKTTSKVAQILYPKAKIYNVGFEKFQLLGGQKASLVIGNPPYGAHKISDKTNAELDGKNIHNYFMGKAIDSLEDGGVMAMVVSSSFLDSSDVSTRAYIGKSANLIGAIRLPKGSFGNANTEIVTDIVFLQKRDLGMESNLDDWLYIGEVNETPINKYYEKNQERLLGIWGKYGTMYRGDEPGLVAREGQDTQGLLDSAIEDLPRFIMSHKDNALAAKMADLSDKKIESNARINSYFINDDKIYKRLGDVNGEAVVEEVTTRTDSKGNEALLSESDILRIKGMISIAAVATELRVKQLDEDAADEVIEAKRDELNDTYDKFVKEFGFLSRGSNSRLFEDDVNAPFLLALEKKYDKGVSSAVAKKNGINAVRESASKADIFFKRTQTPYRAPVSAKSFEDALSVCLGEKTYVDIHYMSLLLKKDEKEVETYLSDDGFIFDDPNEGWVTKETYLSGNVKEKYSQTNIPRNLEALESVLPEDIPAIDISVSCGAGWLPAKDVKDFVTEITGDEGKFACFYTPLNAAWNLGDLRASSRKAEEYGTQRKSVDDVLLAALNNRQLTVYDTIGSGSDAKKVVNQDDTTAANNKVDLVKERWSEWIWESAERRERLGRMYNDKFNVYAKREFDGSHLKLSGKVDDSVIEFRPHQKNGVWRALQSGRALLDHTVGSGKTFTGVASAMELKRTAKANKPLVVVPKHLVSQWAKEWLELYPNANLLVPTEKDFTPSRRKLLMSRIATGEYDGIIISHSHLGKIENDRDFEIRFIESQIQEIKDAINALRLEDGRHGMTAKQWQLTQDKLEYKLSGLINKSKDDNISFLELGIDAMIVDEFHEFKNLGFHTSLQRLAKGLGNPAGSQKAFDMYIKTQSLLEKTGNKNLIVLTGTPISNSIAEMFTIKRYLAADELKAQGLSHFDAWVKQYAEIKTDWELTASTQYKLATRLSKFKNMPELIGAYSTFADVVNIDMVKKQLAKEGKTLDLPTVKDGKPNNMIVERSEEQAQFIGVKDEKGFYGENSLVYRSENLPKGKPKKGDDNMLVIMGHARKASLDMRLINDSYGDFEGSKVNRSIEDMLGIYKKWEILKGVQLVFCDLSTPKGAVADERAKIQELIAKADSGDERAIEELDKISADDLDALDSKFSVYDDIRSKLIANGVREDEIAFIHDAKTPLQKEELFAKVNGGKIRFLLGSTSKMGSGMNVQKRLVGLHHLDVPWRPSDLEQREGRIIRQGNLLFSLYKAIKESGYSLAALKDNEKFKAVSEELGIKDVAIEKIIADAKEHGGDFEVEINRYATKNTLDSGLWEKIEAKAKFIAQIRSGEIKDREVEDITGEAANAAEMKAAASGNPFMVEEMKLKTDISKLEAIKKNFNRGLYDREARIAYYQKGVDSFENDKVAFEQDMGKVGEYRAALEADRMALEKLKADNKSKGISNKDVRAFSGFLIELSGKSYNNREDAGATIVVAGRDLLKSGKESVSLGRFAEFDLSVSKYSKFDNTFAALTLEGASGEYSVKFTPNEQSAGGLSTKLANKLEEIGFGYESLLKYNEKILKELPELEKMSKEFPKEAELALLKKRYKVVIEELKSLDKNKNVAEVAGVKSEAGYGPAVNDWVDFDKTVLTADILRSKRVDSDILEQIKYRFVGKCLVLDEQMERSDYLKFEKIFKVFGGEWDKRLNAVVFSDDGLNRIKDVFGDEGVSDKQSPSIFVNNKNIKIEIDERVDDLILGYLKQDLDEAKNYKYSENNLEKLIVSYLEKFKQQIELIRSKDLSKDVEHSKELYVLLSNSVNERTRLIFKKISGLDLGKTQKEGKAVFESYFGTVLNEVAEKEKKDEGEKIAEEKNLETKKEKLYFSHEIFDTEKIMLLSPMERGRIKKSLDVSFNFREGGVMSLKEKLESVSGIEKEMTDNTHKWNRSKYNQMDGDEQREYDKKLKVGRTFYAGGYEVPKIVFNALDVKDVTSVELLRGESIESEPSAEEIKVALGTLAARADEMKRAGELKVG